ncbi:MAG: PEP-CTERM sorting domain-containing protein, partial [Opitutaceae bacterium]|nr:PEP-CTERM sorting domain-containing protein [Opitutaceae bacterium]
ALDAYRSNITGTLRVFDGISRIGAGGLTVNSAGRVFVTSTLELGGASSNQGRITLMDGMGLINGSTLGNSGLITGDGQIASQVTNLATGEIRSEAGSTIALTHAGGLDNRGLLALNGGTLEVTGALTNTTSGAVVSGRGSLIAHGGLTNSRSMNFSSGTTDIYGNVANTGGGTIITSGGSAAVTTFHDDLSHQGAEIRTSEGSSTVIFGTLSGSGAFTGTGSVFIEGGLNIGSSPGLGSFGGNLSLGANTTAIWEINDVNGAAGTNWDFLQIGGVLSITATTASPHTIYLTTLDFQNDPATVANFDSASDYSFAYASATGGVTGFSTDKFVIDTGDFLNAFAGDWSITLDGNTINLNYSAVPEPSTYAALVGFTALGLAIWRRRRAANQQHM